VSKLAAKTTLVELLLQDVTHPEEGESTMEKAVQLKSGNWRQRVTDPNTGKRHSVTAPGPTDRKVKKAAALLLAELAKKAEVIEPEKTETRFDLFAEQWLHTRRPGEPDGYAVSSYRKRLHHLAELNRTFGGHNIEDITPAMVRAWFLTKASTPTQRHTLYWFLHSILEVALDDELIQRNPCRVKGANKRAEKQRPTFTDTDVEKLYKAAPEGQMKAMLTVLRGTALRVGELVALDWEDIDFLHSKLHVTKHWTPWGIQPGTKTGPEHVRTLDLPAYVQAALEKLVFGTNSEGPIFRHTYGGRLTVDGAEKRFEKIREKAGLPDMHLHDLRHISLTAYGHLPGITTKEVMAFGGHLSERVALGYQHVSDERAVQHAAATTTPYWVQS
jgi:integrase